MDTLTLQKLRIKNFKGIKDLTLEPDGKNIAVYGENGTGKTTIADAFFWLIFGKDSSDKADFQIKPTDDSGGEIHHLETEVEGVFEINGKTVTLMKRFYEKWTKKRGTATEEFSGHSIDCFVDEVPVKSGQYAEKVAEIVNINAFKLVTNPYEFANLHWTGRRQLLLEVCGDISDQDVIESDQDLESLSSILGDCSIDDHKSKVKSKQKKINEELKQIPARISENLELSKNSKIQNKKEKDQLEEDLREENEKLRQLTSNEAMSAKQIRLNEVNAEIQLAKNAADIQQAEQKKPLLSVIEKLEKERRESVSKISDLQSQIQTDEKRLKISEESIKKTRARWIEVDEKQSNHSDSCPACGQSLPEDQIAAAVEKFNQQKARELENIEKEGQGLKEFITSTRESIEKSNASIDTLSKIIDAIDKTIEFRKEDLEKIYVPVHLDDLDREKDILESEIKALKNGSAIQEETARRHISEIQAKIYTWQEADAAYRAAEKCRVRVQELEEQEKRLAAEYERLESELFLIEKFIVKKVEMLEGNINSKFQLAKFKLFDQQINGGINECCEIMFNGILFDKGLNTAARLNVGLDIINTLSEYFGFSGPVFVDGRESVNELISIKSQLISLCVSKDKELTVSETEVRKAS